jgi:nucleotide-binding universal stress UspA family protein
MNEPEKNHRPEIQRILVTLDSSPGSLTRLESAAELAANLQAELTGLFVEDANLLRLAQLPFTTEIGLSSPIGRRLKLEQLHYHFRAQSQRMRRALAAIAQAKGVSWSFNVVRGSVAAEVLAAASDTDLLILGKMTWAPAGGKRLGSTVRMILTQGRGLTLIIQEKTSWAVPISVIYDGSSLSAKALYIAARLSQAKDRRLSVFILASERETAFRRKERVLEELAPLKLPIDFHIAINPSLESLAWLVRLHTSGPILIPCSEKFLQGEGLFSLVNEISNPVLLIR